VDGTVYATLVVGDTVFVGGSFSNAVAPTGGLVQRQNLAAFSLATGALIASWRADAGASVRALASDGRWLYVGGSFGRLAGQTRMRLARVDVASAALDAGFAPVLDDTVRALAVTGDRIYAGGPFLTVNGVGRNRLVRLDSASGAVDPQFAAAASGPVYGLRISPGRDRLYVAGGFAALNGVGRSGVGAVDADTGAVVGPAFASSARPTFGLDISPDGTRLYGAGGSGTNAAAAWDTGTGTRTWRVVADGDIQALRYFGGTVYFGFHDGFQGDSSLKALAADAATGVLDPSFRPRIVGFWGVWAIDVTDEGVVLGGDFTQVSGVPARGWARFPRSGTPPPPPPVVDRYAEATTRWRYRDTGSPPSGWASAGLDDTAWSEGLPQLGYGDGDESTVISYGSSSSSKHLAYYFRTRIEVTRIPDQLALELAADDGAVVYVNGVEAARDNMPAGTVTKATRASSGRSGGAENALRHFDLDPALLSVGTNVVAVEVHQVSPSSSDVSFDANLTGTIASTPNAPPVSAFTAIATGLTVSFDGAHSSDPDGVVTDWSWDFGDGTTDARPAVSHDYASPGTYTVTLRVADNRGAHDTSAQQVRVQEPLVTARVVSPLARWRWRYRSGGPPRAWNQPGFGARAWPAGRAVLGFGHSSVVTKLGRFPRKASRPKSAYFVRTFRVPDLSAARRLALRTVADDGIVVYVNGTEVARSNMPAGRVRTNTSALTARSSTTAADHPLVIEVPLQLLTDGVNTIAAETHLKRRRTANVTFRLSAMLTSRG
jgi:PKD repeat protein